MRVDESDGGSVLQHQIGVRERNTRWRQQPGQQGRGATEGRVGDDAKRTVRHGHAAQIARDDRDVGRIGEPAVEPAEQRGVAFYRHHAGTGGRQLGRDRTVSRTEIEYRLGSRGPGTSNEFSRVPSPEEVLPGRSGRPADHGTP